MELWSLIIGIASLIVGIVSIVLAKVAMDASEKESERSADNYNKTKELLNDIEHKSDLIDRAVQIQQAQLVQIINKALDKVGQSPIEWEPITMEEIDKLFEEKQKPINKEIQELNNKVEKMPKIYTSIEEPTNLKTGDIWFKPE